MCGGVRFEVAEHPLFASYCHCTRCQRRTGTAASASARIAEGLGGWEFVPSRFNGLMAAYHSALESGAELPVTLADARQSLELVTALMYSGQTGAPVTLPIDAAHPKYRDWRPAKKAP